MKTVNVTATPLTITIEISVPKLIFAQENRGELKNDGFRVVDGREFSIAVSEQLSDLNYDSETGISKLKRLIDECVDKVIESGSTCVEINEF